MKKLAITDYMVAKKGAASFGDYTALAKARGATPMSKAEYDKALKALPGAEDDDEEPVDAGGDADGGDAEEEDEDADKSVQVGDLMKAIDAYSAVEAATTQAGGGSRESYLKARLDGGVITKSEMGELGRLWAGMTEDGPTDLRKSLREVIAEGDANASVLVDGSDFLSGLVKSIDASLERVEGEVTRDGLATRALLKAQGALIKSMAGVIASHDVVSKALAQRLQVVEGSPAPRRSVSADPRATRDRFGGAAPRGGGAPEGALIKSEVFRGLTSLMQSARNANDEAAIDRIAHETAKYESTGMLHPRTEQAIRQAIAV